MFRLCIIYNYSIIYFNDYPFTLHFNVFSEPLVIVYINFFHIHYIVQAASTYIIRMRIVYLHFISPVRPATLLIFGMKINTGISMGHGFSISFKFKIFEIMLMHIAIIKKMGCFAMHYDHSAVGTK